MALGLGDVLKLKGLWDRFTRNHPKFPSFLNAAKAKGFPEGTVLAFSITYPDGQTLETNIKITADDLDLFDTVSKMQ